MFFMISIYISKNLYATETILPKAQPKIEVLTKEEIILPKRKSEKDNLQEEKSSQTNTQLDTEKSLVEKLILPKKKPL